MCYEGLHTFKPFIVLLHKTLRSRLRFLGFYSLIYFCFCILYILCLILYFNNFSINFCYFYWINMNTRNHKESIPLIFWSSKKITIWLQSQTLHPSTECQSFLIKFRTFQYSAQTHINIKRKTIVWNFHFTPILK